MTAARTSSRDRREQYLDAAARIAQDHGVALVTMEAVAAAVGVNKALLYRQFDNRGELLLELFDRETAELDRRALEATAGVIGFEPKIRAWARAWFDHLAERAALFGRLMEARAIVPEVAVRHRERLNAGERNRRARRAVLVVGEALRVPGGGRPGQQDPARLGDAERRAEQRLRRCRAERNDHLRLEQAQFGDEPGPARADLVGVGRRMDAPLAATTLGELEVLHRIGRIDL